METNKPKKRGPYFTNSTLNDYIKKEIKPIFLKVLQETPPNRMSVGLEQKKGKATYLNIHNYRLYIDFDKTTFSPKPHFVPRFVTTHRVKNKTEHEFIGFMGCRITVKKTQVEIINLINPGKYETIPLNTNAKEFIKQIIDKKEKETLGVLKEFIRTYGGHSHFNILNRHSENKVIGEDYIDTIPIKAKWDSKLTKKVYNEQNVEFKDPTYASNYIENRAIESVAPELNTKIDRVIELFIMKTETDRSLALNLQAHIKAIKDIGRGFERFNNLLGSPQKLRRTASEIKNNRRLTEWF